MILEHIQSPADVKSLEREQLPQLCQELRKFLVQHVSETGGHLASNLGAVELTVAIHFKQCPPQHRAQFCKTGGA